MQHMYLYLTLQQVWHKADSVPHFSFFISVKPFGGSYGFDSKLGSAIPGGDMGPAWQGRSIAGPKLRMVEFSAFLEQQRDPDSVSNKCFSVTPVCVVNKKYLFKKKKGGGGGRDREKSLPWIVGCCSYGPCF